MPGLLSLLIQSSLLQSPVLGGAGGAPQRSVPPGPALGPAPSPVNSPPPLLLPPLLSSNDGSGDKPVLESVAN